MHDRKYRLPSEKPFLVRYDQGRRAGIGWVSDGLENAMVVEVWIGLQAPPMTESKWVPAWIQSVAGRW